MGQILMWGAFVAVNVGVVWCLWILAREAQRHAAWHIAARRDRRMQGSSSVAGDDFQVVAVRVLPGQCQASDRGLRRAG